MRIAPLRRPSMAVRGARGTTRTANETRPSACLTRGSASAAGFSFILEDVERARRCRRFALPRAVEQHLLFGAVLILVAHELERAIERLNRGLERSLDVTTSQP